MTDQFKPGCCCNVVGPVWKEEGESWACVLPYGHAGNHESGDGGWWAPDVGNWVQDVDR